MFRINFLRGTFSNFLKDKLLELGLVCGRQGFTLHCSGRLFSGAKDKCLVVRPATLARWFLWGGRGACGEGGLGVEGVEEVGLSEAVGEGTRVGPTGGQSGGRGRGRGRQDVFWAGGERL